MREADFFDQVKLVAVDHPANEEIYANEIYATNPGPPVALRVRDKRFPVSAVDDQGHDVLPLLLEQDGRYPTDFARNRILGMADLHSLTLDLGNLPAGAPGEFVAERLGFLDGLQRRARPGIQPELQMVSPYLQVRDAKRKMGDGHCGHGIAQRHESHHAR